MNIPYEYTPVADSFISRTDVAWARNMGENTSLCKFKNIVHTLAAAAEGGVDNTLPPSPSLHYPAQ